MSPSVPQVRTGAASEEDLTVSHIVASGRQSNDISYGDSRPRSSSSSVRIGFWNCGGFSAIPDLKDTQIRNIITDNKFDVFGISECNLHWPKVDTNSRLHARTRGWFETLHLSSAVLTPWSPRSPFQPGGVSLWSLNQMAHRVSSSGSDKMSLGRWAWTTYRGPNNCTIRIVSVYRCTKNISGPISTWSQQRLNLDLRNISEDPREVFINDLLNEIDVWLEAGDTLILGGDINEDIRSSPLSHQLASRGILEINHHRHDYLPATYHRGSLPIDGIYVSSRLGNSLCGYLPIFGDHRILWIDIPTQWLFGHHQLPLNKIRARRLQLLDPRIVQRYTDHLHKYYEKNDMFQKVNDLVIRAPSISLLQLESEYNSLDEIRVAGMKDAESNCRKLRMGERPFTPEYTLLVRKARFWGLALRLRSGRKVDSRFFRKQLEFMQLTQVDFNLLDVETIRSNKQRAYRKVNSLSKSAETSRNTWLQELCEARALAGDTNAATELKVLMHREKQRKDARNIKWSYKSFTPTGLTMLHVKQGDSIVEITDKTTMESMLCTELAARFHQASTTPFATAPLLQITGPLGLSDQSKLILQGTYIPPTTIDYWTRQFITQLRYIPDAATVQNLFEQTISTDQHVTGWKKMKESTSPGFSNLSFAQFKATRFNKSLASIDTALANIPYQFGISPKRWQSGVDVMLQKQTGNFQVDKLRAILLYEADFNQNNKRFGRDWIRLAESTSSLAVEQFGSRKYLSAIDQSLNKTLTFDLFRQLRRPGAIISTDAKSCYDRILHNVASLCLQRIGVPTGHIRSMFTTIQHLNHHVRTLHGDSSQSFSGIHWTSPIHGVGQGNGAGPQIWAAVSSPIFDMLRKHKCGAMFHSPLSNEYLHFVGYAFVDDTDLVAFHPSFRTAADAQDHLQHAMNAWEGGIRATGGAIVPEKSHWYLVDFEWKNGAPLYKFAGQSIPPLTVRNASGTRSPIRQLQPNCAERTLGVRLAPDGNMQAQLKFLSEKVSEWCNNMRQSHLPRHLMYQAFLTTISKTLQFCLPATTFTEKECKKIMNPLHQLVLPKSGIVRTFPTALVHGPSSHFGLSFPHLYWIQGLDHLDRLIRYGRSNHLTGRLLRQSLEYLRLEIGCNGQLFNIPYSIFGILATKSWVKSTWEFIQQFHINFQMQVPEIPLQRQNDELLIPFFVRKGYTGEALKRLNQCRMYLQVSTIGEVSTACGRFLHPPALNGLRTFPTNTYPWPMQQAPTPSTWHLWKSALRLLCHTGYSLQYPLGDWLSPALPPAWYSERFNRIYVPNQDSYLEYVYGGSRPSRQSIARYKPSHVVSSYPNDSCPATFSSIGNQIKITGVGKVLPISIVPRYSRFSDFLVAKLSSAEWLTESIEIYDAFPQTIRPFQQHQLSAISDGSYKDGWGTASWTVNLNYRPIISGNVIVPGPAYVQSSYRSELAGLYCILVVLYHIQEFFNIHIDVTIGCDGLSALEMLQTTEDHINPNLSQYDLIYAIRHYVRNLTGQITLRHILGHQDKEAIFPLDYWASANIDMDYNAKQYWLLSHDRSPLCVHIPGESGYVTIRGQKMVVNFRQKILDYIGSLDAQYHWNKTNHWPEYYYRKINWGAISGAMNTVPRYRQVWISKHASRMFSYGINMVRWKFSNDPACPRCQRPESASHVLTCTEATGIWNKSIQKFKHELQQVDTHPTLTRLLIFYISQWRNPNSQGQTSFPATFNDLIADQSTIGWDNCLNGFLSLHWQSIQENYLKSINSTIPIKRWITALIIKLWNISWDMWQHRNEALHHRETGQRLLQLNQEILILYQRRRPQNLPVSLQILQVPVAQILNYPLAAKELWIARVKAAFDRMNNYTLHRGSQYSTEQQIMHHWLHRSLKKKKKKKKKLFLSILQPYI